MASLRVLIAVAATSLFAAVAPAHAATTLQPGDSVTNAWHGQCTLGFVFEGEGTTYFSTAAHCAGESGLRARDAEGIEFGTFVFVGHWGVETNPDYVADPVGAVEEYARNAIPTRAMVEGDVALIAVDEEDRDRVRGAVRGHPEFPTGVALPEDSLPGDPVQFSGHPGHTEQLQTVREQRRGALISHDATLWSVAGPLWWGDSGGPVVLWRSGAALGIVSRLCYRANACVAEGPTVQGIIAAAADRGLELTLATA